MILGIGSDIIEVERIKKAMESSSFVKKVFCESEIAYMGDKESRFQHGAGMYAAKEAVSKALGSGFRGFTFTDIEIQRDKLGKPFAILKKGALEKVEAYKNWNINITISHVKENAIAFAIIEDSKASEDKIIASDIEFLKKHIPLRKQEGHKGTFGRTIIVGGTDGYYGAPFLAARAAARSGSGLVTIASKNEVIKMLIPSLREVMAVFYEEDRFDNIISNADSIGIGPGMGTDDTAKNILLKVTKAAKCPMVVDADALNILSKDKNAAAQIYSKNVIITPHPGEMARLTGESVEFINKNRVETAEKFALENGIVVLLKGHNTVITNGKDTYINPTGSSAMASGGMGDCLTGIISSFIAQGMDIFTAGVCGAFVHGYAGDELSKKMHSVLAMDVAEEIPFILKKLLY
ncbi:NAD(P)H-hydrate dehydratase [Clostridium sp. 19966]|uniref:NAD(P)H-hydrate dehydratase n=1 Tax=Clostridium sp. 19966 TaxID=2768166 RepID=UPI0028DDAE93|nr:NAD(P)H-hydrate dehydratase [Clostridium sp. 19966]MDT8716111.1 NAD(P)H-hydrate dehydratase [Clostridium sp. 19966]